jgi:glucokinase
MKEALAIGIDLGATNIKGVLINRQGEVLQYESCITNEKAATDIIWKEAVASIVKKLQGKEEQSITAIGLSAPGIPNDDNTCIAFMPSRLIGIENFVWSGFLHKETKVINDANAALLAEAYFGVGKGVSNMVMLTLGTGVGGSIFINGSLYQGFHQMAGHLGHLTVDANDKDLDITGTPGSLEDAIGDATVSRRSYGRFTSTRSLVEAYQTGDTFATYLWLDAIKKLAVGLSSICNSLSPERIILGGGIIKAEEALMQPLADFMELYEWRPGGKKTPIFIAKYQDYAGAIGAAVFAFKNKLILK